MDNKARDKEVEDVIKLGEMLGVNLRNPAALGAFMKGDLGNALVASTPGGIEAQEKSGQDDLVKSDLLPIDTRMSDKIFEQMGIVFGDAVDDLFRRAKLPVGWKKVPTEHQMWSNLFDDKGRKRASIFFKAAFYDRGAHMSADRRYSYHVDPDSGYGKDQEVRASCWHARVYDCDSSVIWTSATKLEPEPGYDDNEACQKWYDAKSELEEEGAAWLNSHYPSWQDCSAYWD